MYLVFVYQTQAYPKLTQQKCREKKPTITSKDKLSRYAISILNKERRLNSGSDIKASRYLFSLDLTPAIEQLKEAVKERVNEMMTEEFPDPAWPSEQRFTTAGVNTLDLTINDPIDVSVDTAMVQWSTKVVQLHPGMPRPVNQTPSARAHWSVATNQSCEERRWSGPYRTWPSLPCWYSLRRAKDGNGYRNADPVGSDKWKDLFP